MTSFSTIMAMGNERMNRTPDQLVVAGSLLSPLWVQWMETVNIVLTTILTLLGIFIALWKLRTMYFRRRVSDRRDDIDLGD